MKIVLKILIRADKKSVTVFSTLCSSMKSLIQVNKAVPLSDNKPQISHLTALLSSFCSIKQMILSKVSHDWLKYFIQLKIFLRRNLRIVTYFRLPQIKWFAARLLVCWKNWQPSKVAFLRTWWTEFGNSRNLVWENFENEAGIRPFMVLWTIF